MKKIIDENFVKKKLKYFKDKGKIIGLCHGVFDLLHIGHIKHLEFAKKSGEILVVSLTKDKFINVCRSCLGVFLYKLDTRTAPRYIKKIFSVQMMRENSRRDI